METKANYAIVGFFTMLVIAAGLLFLTVWFQPGGAFIPAFLSAAVLLAVGYFILKSPKKH